ncbi:MAG: dihydropteroate synthase [Thermoplasmata archaeon]
MEYKIPIRDLVDFQAFLVTTRTLDISNPKWNAGRYNIYALMFKDINDLLVSLKHPLRENFWKLPTPIRIRGRPDAIDFPSVMTILNMTPDSFYPGSRLRDEQLNERLDEIEKIGGNIVDIGGQSTRPGSEQISSQEEMKRISKAVEISLNRKFTVSIDSYRPEILKECLDMGAHIINDVTGGENREIRNLAKYYDVPLIVMHKKGDFKTMQNSPSYENVINEISLFFLRKIVEARELGIEDNLILDPGIGFGKRVEDNLSIINNLRDFKMGHPLLIGLSRKNFIGKLLDESVDERGTSSLIFNSITIMNGADIIRVHDIDENIKLIKIIKKLKEY